MEITRRNVAKGAAWATPLIVATTTVPAYAASACKPEGLEVTTAGFLYTGDYRYTKDIRFTAIGKTIKPGELTVTLNTGGLPYKYSFTGTDSWSIDSEALTATYVGPEVATAETLRITVLHNYPEKIGDNEQWNAYRDEYLKTEPVHNNFQSAVTVKTDTADNCYSFFGGVEGQDEHDVEIGYD